MGHILIVEDDLRNMELAAYILESSGHNVLRAVSASEGIDLAREARPDLVLMDIQLPGLDGLEAVRYLKQDPVTHDIPVVAVTGFAMPGDEERMQHAGFQGYLAKPYRHKDLTALINKVLDK